MAAEGRRRRETDLTICADCMGKLPHGSFPCFHAYCTPPKPLDTCHIHPDEKLRFFCTKCEEPICRDCKLTQHDRHETCDLTAIALKKKDNLLADQQRMKETVSAMMETMTSLRDERRGVEERRIAMEKSILNRHSILMAAADAKRDELLRSSQSLSSYENEKVGRVMDQHEDRLKEVLKLQEQVEDTLTSGTAVDIVTVAKEMETGSGSPEAVACLTSREDRNIRRPVLHFHVSTDVMVEETRECLGNVTTMEVKPKTQHEMKVTERFQCGEDPDIEVFSLCHLDTDPPRLNVSFERYGQNPDAPKKSFTESGKRIYSDSKGQTGKLSYKRIAQGRSTYHECCKPGRFITCCKSPSTETNFWLRNGLSGHADIFRETVTSLNPFLTDSSTEFSIQVGPHRAFDVDETEQFAVVVEEEAQKESGTPWRSVRLYCRESEKAVSTYNPLTEGFQPSDVCFYTLGGESVLLIADERNDAIHVVTIQGRKLQFERFLCESCPSLIGPTAMTVDIRGRLWVACRGGLILRMEKIVV